MAKLNWQWLSLSQTCQHLKSGQASVTQLTQEMLEVLGLDLTDDSLEETPMRVAKM